MQITSIGIDLGKTTFHLVALDERGKVVIRQKFSRKQLLAFTANLPSSLIGIEACSGAHFMGAALREQGHEVALATNEYPIWMGRVDTEASKVRIGRGEGRPV